jgi:PDZ domain
MSSPKHLWSGDWEQESAAAAAQRANREARAWPQPLQPPPEPEFRPRRVAAPQPPAPRSTPRTQRRIRRPRPRVALLSALALLLLAGAAYGLTSLHRTTATATTKAAWLGARLESWPAGGALVARVENGGAAAAAGLKPGDIIIQVQGRPVTAPYNITSAIAALSPGDRLQMQVVRGSRIFPAIATLGARPPDAP